MAKHVWLRRRWHTRHYPLSLHVQNFWTSSVRTWPSSEDETAFGFMPHLQNCELVRCVLPCQGELLIDVGGCIGSYSIGAKLERPVGRLPILKPESNNHRLLERNLALNEITNCQVSPRAT